MALTAAKGVRSLRYMLDHPKHARVLFDEAHSEAWTIRPELAAQMQPAHPEDSSLARAAAAARARARMGGSLTVKRTLDFWPARPDS